MTKKIISVLVLLLFVLFLMSLCNDSSSPRLIHHASTVETRTLDGYLYIMFFNASNLQQWLLIRKSTAETPNEYVPMSFRSETPDDDPMGYDYYLKIYGYQEVKFVQEDRVYKNGVYWIEDNRVYFLEVDHMSYNRFKEFCDNFPEDRENNKFLQEFERFFGAHGDFKFYTALERETPAAGAIP